PSSSPRFVTTRCRATASATARASCASATTRTQRTAPGARSGRPGARTTRPSRRCSAAEAHEHDPRGITDSREAAERHARVALVPSGRLDHPEHDQREDEDCPRERGRTHVDQPEPLVPPARTEAAQRLAAPPDECDEQAPADDHAYDPERTDGISADPQ